MTKDLRKALLSTTSRVAIDAALKASARLRAHQASAAGRKPARPS